MPKDPNPQKDERSREVWIELRTQKERIEGVVHMPKGSKGRRIADLLQQADRGSCGMLHLTNVTAYDLETNEVRFRKRSLAVNRSMVVYAGPLASGETLPKRVFEPPLVGMSAN